MTYPFPYTNSLMLLDIIDTFCESLPWDFVYGDDWLVGG